MAGGLSTGSGLKSGNQSSYWDDLGLGSAAGNIYSYPGSSGSEAPGSAGLPAGGKGTSSGAATGGVTMPNIPTPNVPAIEGPDRPDLPPIDPQAPFDPNLEAYRDRYLGNISNLEQGTGYAMDVMRGQQQDQLEADVKRAREAAAAQGIPFNEAEFRAEASRGINAAMANEKLGREQLVNQAYTSGLPIIAEPASERYNRLALDLQRDTTEGAQLLQRYGIDVSKYGSELSAAVAANNALYNLYASLMSGMFGMMGNFGSSVNMGSVDYG